MNFIKLQPYHQPKSNPKYTIDKNYSIRFPNNRLVTFRSKNQMDKFISDSEKTINYTAEQLIEIQIILYSEYYKVFIVSDKKEIANVIRENERLIDRLYNHTGTTNGNYFIFRFIKTISENQIYIANFISKIYKGKQLYFDARRIANINTRIESLNKSMDNIGINLSVQISV